MSSSSVGYALKQLPNKDSYIVSVFDSGHLSRIEDENFVTYFLGRNGDEFFKVKVQDNPRIESSSEKEILNIINSGSYVGLSF
jgi:hypothetical protein